MVNILAACFISCVFYALFNLLTWISMRREDRGCSFDRTTFLDILCVVCMILGLVGVVLIYPVDALKSGRAYKRSVRGARLAVDIAQYKKLDEFELEERWEKAKLIHGTDLPFSLWARTALDEEAGLDYDDVFPHYGL